MNSFQKGFISKCAALGLTPEQTVKLASFFEDVGNFASNHKSELIGGGVGALAGGGLGYGLSDDKNKGRNAVLGALGGGALGAGGGYAVSKYLEPKHMFPEGDANMPAAGSPTQLPANLKALQDYQNAGNEVPGELGQKLKGLGSMNNRQLVEFQNFIRSNQVDTRSGMEQLSGGIKHVGNVIKENIPKMPPLHHDVKLDDLISGAGGSVVPDK